MIYLSGVHSPVIAASVAPRPGLMMQPGSGTVQHQDAYRFSAFDNGAFGAWKNGTPFRFDLWERQLRRVTPDPGRFLFAVVPDVVGDHLATAELWKLHAVTVLGLGLPAAFVLQNGCTDLAQVPSDASAVFIGGDDAYKLGPHAARVCWQARAAGLWVHMGRVNGQARFCRAVAMGCDSVDGTFLRFGAHLDQLARLAQFHAAGARVGGQLDLLDHA